MVRVFTVAVHMRGEDNEGNYALVARTQAALEAKLLASFQQQDAPTIANLEEAWEYWDWAFSEDELED